MSLLPDYAPLYKQLAATPLAGWVETVKTAVVFNATDSARALAAEHNINLADITGTGVDGRITKGDVELAIAAASVALKETAGGDE